MGAHLAWKLGLGTAGTLAALGSAQVGLPWLFPAGLGLVVLALVLPSRKGQTLKAKLSFLLRHLPGGRWLAPPEDPSDSERSGRDA